MSANPLVAQAPQIQATLLHIFEAQKEEETAKVLRAAVPAINFLRWDGWNDETAVHEIVLAIPPVLYARVEASLENIEQAIAQKLLRLPVNTDTVALKYARICPQLLAGPGGGSSVAPSSADIDRIWGTGKLRVFVSHVSTHKALVSKLKAAMSSLGLAAFVAHQDVEPNLEWQREIETALLSMDVLCALLTPDFHGSNWTDQEIGFALGRNVPIVAVRVGKDPYGFIGKIQAVTGDLAQSNPLAAGIFDATMRVDALRERVLELLVSALAEAPSYLDARSLAARLVSHQTLLTKVHVERLLRAARDNSQVRDAFGVAAQIARLAAKAGVTLPQQVPQQDVDDDIPF